MEARGNNPSDQPLACSLETGALEERRARWRALVARALVEQHATETGVRQRYRAEPGVAEELRELALAERECCGFANWEVRPAGEFVELEVSSPGDGATVLREMFSAA